GVKKATTLIVCIWILNLRVSCNMFMFIYVFGILLNRLEKKCFPLLGHKWLQGKDLSAYTIVMQHCTIFSEASSRLILIIISFH
ncbi:hypothetical protein BLOT_001237, partial [Blomia tropicalis]